MKRFAGFLLILFSLYASAQTIDVQHYKFEIGLSDQSDAVNGKAFITVRFLTDAPIVNFDLVSGEEEKGMYVFQVKENGRLLTSTHRNDIVTINLSRPAKKES